ncbi:MAG: methyltransferase [Candidatus Fluviicola riflensis]|nr:MAG: methyltransferase [Candidatus Fluviicola riflensis]OGS79195.1 MAG: methyltransferase [Candidatus Fluviicola riflensis]OGS86627.1 MAG: methyltransferase [Fluviicola sp. RIFCSPHIGHO2_01_FULL_43_53]OGS88899.1 MAG: methyltransferase [Fluviicola sp. RIFCSPHIGHO2_12_FULL_43_24]
MEFIAQELDDYVCKHTSPENELLAKLNRETHLKIMQPRMLSGHFQGRVLSMLSHMIHPERILEIGTYTGYSALCLAEGLTETGKLITIDVNAQLESFVREQFKKSELNSKIDFRIANAMELIPQLDEQFDIVFIDADKQNYINYYHLVFDKVKKGGYILADNVLWSGKVTGDYEKLDKDTRLLMDFNKLVQEDERVENVLLPIRDGIMIARKI